MNKFKKEFENTNTRVFDINTLRSQPLKWVELLRVYITKEVPEDLTISDQCIHRLLRNNVKPFKELYGKQTFCTSDRANRRLYVWKHQISENTCVWLLTAATRGTSYEYSGSEYEVTKFLIELSKTLN